MNVLVTGGAGFVGSHLCEKLRQIGCQVWSLDNYFSGSYDNHVQGVTYLAGETKDISKNFKDITIDKIVLGYKVNMRTKAIIIEKVWQQIDGLDYKTWNGTTKGGYVWAYDAGSNSWISSQSNPSHQIFGNYGAFTSLIDSVTGHPLPGWFAFGLIPGQNPATGGGGIFGYEDIYGNIWDPLKKMKMKLNNLLMRK